MCVRRLVVHCQFLLLGIPTVSQGAENQNSPINFLRTKCVDFSIKLKIKLCLTKFLVSQIYLDTPFTKKLNLMKAK